MRTPQLLLGFTLIFTTGCAAQTASAPVMQAHAKALKLVNAARGQIGVTVTYDPAYVGLGFPGGDVPADRGVCTDVVVRAFRVAHQYDLQKEVHEDMRANFRQYPQLWGLSGPDRNIDHRRVHNLNRFFARKGKQLEATQNAADYIAGDLVSWKLSTGQLHIGIISNKRLQNGVPLVIHNIGAGVREENLLFELPIVAHSRFWSASKRAQPVVPET